MKHIAEAPPAAALAWIAGRDTGLSSMCIWRTMMGVPEPNGFYRHAHPHDPDDLLRCLRLLQVVPEWRPRIGEMWVHGPVWAALAENWGELEALFIEEFGTADMEDRSRFGVQCERTYRRMRELIEGAERKP